MAMDNPTSIVYAEPYIPRTGHRAILLAAGLNGYAARRLTDALDSEVNPHIMETPSIVYGVPVHVNVAAGILQHGGTDWIELAPDDESDERIYEMCLNDRRVLQTLPA